MELAIQPAGVRICFVEQLMPPRKKKPTSISLTTISVVCGIVFSVLSFFGGMAINAYTIASNVATKPYVDEGLSSVRKYADERSNLALEKAMAHSDSNRQQMTNQVLSLQGDVKAQSSQLTIIVDSIKEIRRENALRKH